MNENRYDYDTIRDYLHGLTDRETAIKVGEWIKADETTRAIAEGILLLEKRFNEDEVSLESYLEEFHQKQLEVIKRSVKSRQARIKYSLRIAAAILLLIAATAVIRIVFFSSNYQELVDKELSQPYAVAVVARSDRDESAKAKGYQLYSERDYLNASRYFEQAAMVENDLASVRFYNALSYLYAGEYEKAIDLFEYKEVSESRYSQQAEWYKIIALLKSGNKIEAKEGLIILNKNKQHYKLKDAQKLLNELE